MSNILPNLLSAASGGETLLFIEALLRRRETGGNSFRWGKDMREEELEFDGM